MADIYGLFDADGELRYIGKANNPAARLKSHMAEIGRRTFPLYSWLRKHGEPMMLVLESNCADWRLAERDWIAEARLAGVPLLNLADGGDEPLCTREQRQANARKLNEGEHRLTSERAREMALRANAILRVDPERRRIQYLKADIGRYVAKNGFTPEHLARLFYCSRRAPKIFGAWFEKLSDKYLKPLNADEWERFERKIDELCA